MIRPPAADLKMRLYEGVIIKPRGDTALWYVKGIWHPEGYVIAFPRYIPDSVGNKVRNGVRYRTLKLFSEQMRYVITHRPEVLRYCPLVDQEVPLIALDEIEEVYDPVQRALELRVKPKNEIERIAAELLDEIYEVCRRDHIGVVGSLLPKFETGINDIDIVVLDIEDGLYLIDHLKKLKIVDSRFRVDYRRFAVMFRGHVQSLKVSFDLYVRLWMRRALEGFFCGVPYFIRILLMTRGRPLFNVVKVLKLSKITTHVKLVRDFYGYTTPCIYTVNVFDRRFLLVSDRGVYTEVLSTLHTFKIERGVLEQVLVNVQGEIKCMTWIYLTPHSTVRFGY